MRKGGGNHSQIIWGSSSSNSRLLNFSTSQILYWAESFNKYLLSIYYMSGSVLYSNLYGTCLRGRYNNLGLPNLDYGLFFSFL